MSLVLVLAVCIFAWFHVERANTYRSQLAVAHQDRHHTTSMIDLYETELHTFIEQWTMWDELQTFAQRPDSEFAKTHLDRPQNEYRLEHIWIFDSKADLTYCRSLEPKNLSRSEPTEIRDGVAVRLRRRSPVAKLFVEHDGAVYEIVGAAIYGC